MLRRHAIKGKQVNTVQHYLEREFPGQVRDTQWDRQSDTQVFEIVHDTTVHRVEMPAAFFGDCPNDAAALRDSELADYIREARAQERRFRPYAPLTRAVTDPIKAPATCHKQTMGIGKKRL